MYFWLFLLALIAEIVGTISGFGSSILFVPLATLIYSFKAVLGITAIFHVFSNLSKIVLFNKGVDRNIVLKLGIPAVIFVFIGALLTNYIPQKEIELVMSVILILLAAYLVFYSKRVIKQSNKNLYIGGISSGLLAGLIGTGGAIRGITLSAFKLEKNKFIATSALIDLGVDSTRAIVYTTNGYFKKEHIILIPFLIVISFVGSWIGKQLLQKISEKKFQHIVLIVIICTSLFQIIKFFYV